MKERGLNLNKDKSVCIAIGSKKQKSEISKAMKESPLMCGDFETKEVEEEKWLGQIISASGLAESVSKTVDARIGKVIWYPSLFLQNKLGGNSVASVR